MKARIATLAALSLTALLVAAAPALAQDNGEGLVGEATDRIITFFSLGLVVFFVLFVAAASWIQSALEKRKEQRKASDLRQRIGW